MTNTETSVPGTTDSAADYAAISGGGAPGGRAAPHGSPRPPRAVRPPPPQGLTDEQARRTPTVSALSLGGLIKHVTLVEAQWVKFIEEGTDAMPSGDDEQDPDSPKVQAWASGFTLLPDETLSGALAEYERVAARTDALVESLPDLGLSHPLPPAPWFAPGAVRSARRVFAHIVAETAQHSGHADIIRETIDGQKTMG